MLVYFLKFAGAPDLKIDFVEDGYKLLKPLKVIDGIPVLSIQDIYFRKVLTVCGSIEAVSDVGRKVFTGGRQEAKDFFDLYFLSKTFMPLAKFAPIYLQRTHIEGIVVWFRTYDRLAIKSGLLDIITDKKVSYGDMERYFKVEIEKLIEGEI